MADVRIKDLAAFSGTPTATDFLAIDSANETKKIPGNSFALNSKVDYMINEIKSTPAGTSKIIISDIPTEEIGGTGLGNEEYFKRTVKKLCEVYPNKSDTLFVGRGRPDSLWFYEICIYNTSEVNSEGLPRYSFGRAFKLNGLVCEAITNEYNWGWRENSDFESRFYRYTPADATQDPNPRQSYGLLVGVDKNKRTLTSIITSKESDGRTGSYLGVHNTDANGNPISNYFVIRLARDGAVTYGVPDPANFRSAIGISYQDKVYSGTFTIGSSNYLLIDDGTDFANKNIMSITVAYWNSNSGAFNVAMGSDGKIYLIGNAGTTVKDLHLRYLLIT